MTKPIDAYKKWLTELKEHIYSSQIKAALKVNAELLALYWHLGNEILDKEKTKGYGKKLIDQLSKDLVHEFPQVKGFSRSNLYFIRQWVLFYAQKRPIVQQPVGQLTRLAMLRRMRAYTSGWSEKRGREPRFSFARMASSFRRPYGDLWRR